jgi:hypothetical protein
LQTGWGLLRAPISARFCAATARASSCSKRFSAATALGSGFFGCPSAASKRRFGQSGAGESIKAPATAAMLLRTARSSRIPTCAALPSYKRAASLK